MMTVPTKFMSQLYLVSIRSNKNTLSTIRVVIKKKKKQKTVQDKRQAKLSEKISELLKTLTGLLFSLISLYFTNLE